MRWVWGGWLAATLAACSGGAKECEQIDITVSVTGPSGEVVSDAIVELNNVECLSNGDGTYVCTASYADADQHLVALHPTYSSVATFVELPENCDTPLTVPLVLGVMMGA